MSNLQAAIDGGKALGKTALYFGCWDCPGHYLCDTRGHHVWDSYTDLPWNKMLDGRLLKNGKHPDNVTGQVWWSCAASSAFWYAFCWWDRSGDKRSASNSGLYVRGFGWPEPGQAFAYACEQFPHIVARQKMPLVLQNAA